LEDNDDSIDVSLNSNFTKLITDDEVSIENNLKSILITSPRDSNELPLNKKKVTFSLETKNEDGDTRGKLLPRPRFNPFLRSRPVRNEESLDSNGKLIQRPRFNPVLRTRPVRNEESLGINGKLSQRPRFNPVLRTRPVRQEEPLKSTNDHQILKYSLIGIGIVGGIIGIVKFAL
jgi:hypothetical protein